MRSLLLISILALAGCEKCDPQFKPGDFVRHRLIGTEALVVRSADIENYQGYCLVDIRTKGGMLQRIDTSELEKIDG